jgi:hypothetical protein
MGGGSAGTIDFPAIRAEIHFRRPNATVWQLDRQSGEILGRVSHKGANPGELLAPHVAAMDSKGSVYVGEIGRPARPAPRNSCRIRVEPLVRDATASFGRRAGKSPSCRGSEASPHLILPRSVLAIFFGPLGQWVIAPSPNFFDERDKQVLNHDAIHHSAYACASLHRSRRHSCLSISRPFSRRWH